MHPIFRNTTSLGAYLGLWTLLAAALGAMIRVPTILSWSQSLSVAVPMCMFYAFVCLTPWYLCRAFPLGSARVTRLLINQLAAAVLACTLWIGVARLLIFAIDLGSGLNPAIPQLVVVGLLLYLTSIALHYAVLAVEASREAALQTRDAELRALKSQINPHFLFNCLNSISALTSTDPARARDMCVLLSDFLRKTLGLGERESITWREELELARTYLDVEQVRFGARLQIEMRVDDACADCQVPPLVLQPLIENAIKHGIATMVDGGIVRLESHVENGNLAVRVENSFDPEAPSPRRHGLGLRNVRSRLQTRFGDAGHLHLAAEHDCFRAEMVIPCHKTIT
jgi:two-component system, LytTR family, sensor histidine kinase AlgZ